MSLRDPIFIIGNPRSGTTLLRLLLSSHSNITVPPECGFLMWLDKSYSQWSLDDTRSPKRLANYLRDLEGCKKFETWKLDIERLQRLIEEVVPENYADLSACVYRAYMNQFEPHSRRWGDKNNFHVTLISEINRLYPTCKFIHICRDVRDVACSYKALKQLETESKFAPNLPDDVVGIAADWRRNIQHVIDDLAQISDARKLTVQYEQLVRTPERQLEKICRKLDERYEPEMLLFHTKSLEPKDTLDWKRKTCAPIDQGSVGKYKDVLSDSEAEYLLSECGDLMASLGYET